MGVLVSGAPGQYRLEGVISFRDEPSKALQNARLVPAEGVVALDLSGLGQSDSVALALLVEWVRQSHTDTYQLHVTGASERLQALMRVTGLRTLFADAG